MLQSETFFEHAWRYFQLHAAQRITVFNFFIFISGVVASGLAASLQGSQKFSSLGIALGFLLCVFSYVFWKLDQRISFLIKHAEAVLIEHEQKFPHQTFKLFSQELDFTRSALTKSNFWRRQWSYGKSFRLIFAVMASFGVGGAILSCLKFLGIVTW